MATAEQQTPVGWWNPQPLSSRSKFHFVGPEGRSLCGKWLYLGGYCEDDGRDDHPDNCAECRRRRGREKARAGEVPLG